MRNFVCYLVDRVADAILTEMDAAQYAARPSTRSSARARGGRSARGRRRYFDIGDITASWSQEDCGRDERLPRGRVSRSTFPECVQATPDYSSSKLLGSHVNAMRYAAGFLEQSGACWYWTREVTMTFITAVGPNEAGLELGATAQNVARVPEGSSSLTASEVSQCRSSWKQSEDKCIFLVVRAGLPGFKRFLIPIDSRSTSSAMTSVRSTPGGVLVQALVRRCGGPGLMAFGGAANFWARGADLQP